MSFNLELFLTLSVEFILIYEKYLLFRETIIVILFLIITLLKYYYHEDPFDLEKAFLFYERDDLWPWLTSAWSTQRQWLPYSAIWALHASSVEAWSESVGLAWMSLGLLHRLLEHIRSGILAQPIGKSQFLGLSDQKIHKPIRIWLVNEKILGKRLISQLNVNESFCYSKQCWEI